MTDRFLKSFPTDVEREKRVGGFFEDTLLPALKDLGTDTIDLEIGCGHGHWLTEYSMAFEQTLFVGIDLITKRVEKATAKMKKRGLRNLIFYKAEAKEFISYLPDSIKIGNTYLMFPDPWPKHKHHKRRLVQPNFLELLAGKTRSNGKLFFRTDFTPYFEWTEDQLEKSPFWTPDDTTLPFEHNSYFQDLLPNFQTLCASRPSGC